VLIAVGPVVSVTAAAVKPGAPLASHRHYRCRHPSCVAICPSLLLPPPAFVPYRLCPSPSWPYLHGLTSPGCLISRSSRDPPGWVHSLSPSPVIHQSSAHHLRHCSSPFPVDLYHVSGNDRCLDCQLCLLHKICSRTDVVLCCRCGSAIKGPELSHRLLPDLTSLPTVHSHLHELKCGVFLYIEYTHVLTS
jgi:hypothetical protein